MSPRIPTDSHLVEKRFLRLWKVRFSIRFILTDMLVYIEELGNKKSIFSRTIVRQTDLTVNRKTGLEIWKPQAKLSIAFTETTNFENEFLIMCSAYWMPFEGYAFSMLFGDDLEKYKRWRKQQKSSANENP